MKKILSITLVILLLAGITVTGTVALLTSEDSDVNVMTLGNVKIEQHEYEREIDAEGAYVTGTVDDRESYVLQPFTQNKPLFPIVGDPNEPGDSPAYKGWDDIPVRMSQVDSYGGMQVFAGKNAQDKFVTVENTGRSDAFVRTLVAIEVGEADPMLIGRSYHTAWAENNLGIAGVDGVNYLVLEYVYMGAELSDGSWRHENGILPAGDTTYPNLSQIYLKHNATNEDLEKIDGNKNGTLEILVLSQAVQTEGFEDARTALDTAFGEATAANVALWLANVELDEADTWDGTADTSWYTGDATEYDLDTAEKLAGFAKLVDEGNSFEGITLTLDKNIDLYAEDENGDRISFDPIGDKNAFKGVFDGQNFTISNMYQSGWAFGYQWGSYGSIGLFGNLEGATVKNLTVSGAEAQIEGGDIGGIVGSATGTCVFENITIKDSKLGTYNNGLGGIIGWSGAGDYTFKNITIGSDVVLAGLWGSFDSSIGGIVGQGEPGATYNFENVDIACRLDVYNDCTASYDYYNYRMCGMIIGRLEKTTTIDGSNYPDTSKYDINCTDVTVTYGAWSDYHYCEPTPSDMNGGRGMRVEPGYTYGGIPADYDHALCTAGGNHMNLIPFDQIFGGAQLGVKGLKTYEGVTVIYAK